LRFDAGLLKEARNQGTIRAYDGMQGKAVELRRSRNCAQQRGELPDESPPGGRQVNMVPSIS
jgi:hypothetical protein